MSVNIQNKVIKYQNQGDVLGRQEQLRIYISVALALNVDCVEGDIHDEPEEVEVVFDRGLCAPLFY